MYLFIFILLIATYTAYNTILMQLLTLLVTYATYNTNTYSTYITYNTICILTLLTILIPITLLTIQHNQITCTTCNSSTARSYQFTPVTNVNSELQITENMHGVYAPCFFSFHFYFRFQGTRVELSRDTKEATEAPTFLKRLQLYFFPFHRYVLNTVRNHLVLENIFSVYIAELDSNYNDPLLL